MVWIYDLDQLGDRLFSIANDMPRHSFCDSDQLAIHHQHPVIETSKVVFDDDCTSMFSRLLEGHACLFDCMNVERHTSSVVGVRGLITTGNPRRSAARTACSAERTVLWPAREGPITDAVGLFLIGCDLHRNVTGLGRNRGLNPLLIFAVPKLNEAVVVQTQPP